MISKVILEQITAIGAQAIFTIMSVVVTAFIGKAFSLLKQRKQALVTQMGIDKYNMCYNFAKSIYYVVEQQCKLLGPASELKRQIFDKMLLAKVPGITQDEIDHFREAVCGEVNTQLKATELLEPVPVYDSTQDTADVSKTKAGEQANA